MGLERRADDWIQHLVPTFTVYNALLAPNNRRKRETSNVMKKEETKEVKGSERERCREDGGVKSQSRKEGVVRGLTWEERRGKKEKEKERERGTRQGDVTRGERKSTERFQRHVGALWAHTIVRSCTLFSRSWKKNFKLMRVAGERAGRTACRFFAGDRRRVYELGGIEHARARAREKLHAN